eukprot:tig00001187_g7454.t1
MSYYQQQCYRRQDCVGRSWPVESFRECVESGGWSVDDGQCWNLKVMATKSRVARPPRPAPEEEENSWEEDEAREREELLQLRREQAEARSFEPEVQRRHVERYEAREVPPARDSRVEAEAEAAIAELEEALRAGRAEVARLQEALRRPARPGEAPEPEPEREPEAEADADAEFNLELELDALEAGLDADGAAAALLDHELAFDSFPG